MKNWNIRIFWNRKHFRQSFGQRNIVLISFSSLSCLRILKIISALEVIIVNNLGFTSKLSLLLVIRKVPAFLNIWWQRKGLIRQGTGDTLGLTFLSRDQRKAHNELLMKSFLRAGNVIHHQIWKLIWEH